MELEEFCKKHNNLQIFERPSYDLYKIKNLELI